MAAEQLRLIDCDVKATPIKEDRVEGQRDKHTKGKNLMIRKKATLRVLDDESTVDRLRLFLLVGVPRPSVGGDRWHDGQRAIFAAGKLVETICHAAILVLHIRTVQAFWSLSQSQVDLAGVDVA